MDNNSFSHFYRKPISERIAILERANVISGDDARALRENAHILAPKEADRMIENVIGVFGLPLGLGVNFRINAKQYVVPMVVEEPSIVAAVSSAAKLVGSAGGFRTESEPQLMTGQIVVDRVPDPQASLTAVLARKSEILSLANSLHPNLISRGGGAKDVEAALYQDPESRTHTLAVHLLVNTCDAMGANLVNSMCEAVAAMIEAISGGRVLLRILSNLCERAIVRAEAVVAADALGKNGLSGSEVRDRIVSAGRFAELDVLRATTHNKGIMNGIDAVAIATGNDWRSIEAAAHAYAAKDHHYKALTRWQTDNAGNLFGRIALPLKVGIVGGSLESNPAVKSALRLLKVESARELAEVMAAVGLAQNLAALRTLVTEGIQKGHMALHARSVAQAAGAAPDIADEVVDRMIASGEIKVQKARDIIAVMRQQSTNLPVKPPAGLLTQSLNSATGKIILLGEHAVVYGSRAIAAPTPQAVYARVNAENTGIHLVVPQWGLDTAWQPNTQHRDSILRAIDHMLITLGITRPAIRITLYPQVPRAMGLGSSAAAAVAVLRALSDYYRLALNDSLINRIAFESEGIMHGKSSGVDNAVAAFGLPILFRAGAPPEIVPLRVPESIPLLIGLSRTESLTAPMVAKVSAALRKNRHRYDAIFRKIDDHVGDALDAIQCHDLVQLGRLINENHRLLRTLRVSTPELEEMVTVARQYGALGAKLTGGGGGGAMIALCPESTEKIARALNHNGWKTIAATIEATGQHIQSQQSPDIISDDFQRLIVVDKDDRETGSCTREECHAGDGIQHRAFSIFIFDSHGRLLMQKRSRRKKLWPLYWSNSCCSHPRVGESITKAAHRRLAEELGISTSLTYLFKFSYQERFGNSGSENEMCSVFVGQTDQTVQADRLEIDAWRFVSPLELDTELNERPERFTPWFKLEWKRLRNHTTIKKIQETAMLKG